MLRTIPRAVLLIAAISLAVHLVLTALFSHTYDSEYWLIIIQNVETGNGLYGLNGFYYTPVWGYMLSFADMLTQALGSIPVLGDRFTDLIVIEDYNGFQAILASPDINFLLKLPLSVCDVIVGYAIYVIVARYTGNERKGIVAMALWCFCPIVVYMSAIQGQFDPDKARQSSASGHGVRTCHVVEDIPGRMHPRVVWIYVGPLQGLVPFHQADSHVHCGFSDANHDHFPSSDYGWDRGHGILVPDQ